jgi:hypothetical protein
MGFSSSALVTAFTAYTRNSSHKELGQVTSVAKQPDPAAQCNGFQNVDWDMQLNVYKIKRCAILLQPQLSPDVDRNIVWQRRQLFFQETEVSIRCRELFKYKRPDDLISNNTTPNINKKNWKCVSVDTWGLLSDQMCESPSFGRKYWTALSRFEYVVLSCLYIFFIDKCWLVDWVDG